ncbi:MAG: hypothetical protein IJI98_10935 [Methanosphaera sp.]|nr:hypothetical protein [Methanobrevibacter sp.]MBQ6754189.1 hypothetical protein [Bacteroidales bacterium]MBR0351307.1 hypothetical protein [Clostridia bacterium]MBR0473193.1 hypothetical protein [Methanosphaera sp.]
MAVIKADKATKPTTIDKFLGLNLSDTGDTQISLGESGNMTNFYITDDLKLRKICGYQIFKQFEEPIKGIFSAKIGDNKYLLVASGSKLYYFDGDLLNSNFEVVPEKYQTFTGDGDETTFQLSKTNVDSIDKVYINGEEQTTGWSGDTVTGEITFVEAPADKAFIRVLYTKPITFVEAGTISGGDASFFEFDNCVYILCGEYYKFYKNQSNEMVVSPVYGYTPTVFINTPAGANGGGTIYEEINMLSPYKRQTFNGDGSTKQFKIAQIPDSITSVKVWDGSAWNSAAYTAASDVITITTAPSQGQDNVEIIWSKDDNDRNIIAGMKFGTVFGGDVDTRVFLYGNPSCQNRVYFSAISYANDIAVPSAEYFPATAQVDIGPLNFAVTDLTRQYDRLLATTNKPEAYYLTISLEQLPVTLADDSTATRYVPAVSTFPLNGAHGNIAPGQGQLLMNYPVTFEDGAIIQWKATNVRDEKNAEDIGQKIKLDLDKIQIHNIKTLDLQEHNQLWIIYENEAWIYNYYNQTYSRLKFPQNVNMTNICSLDGKVYMSTNDNEIVKFDEIFTTYGGETIEAYWEMNFSDFGVPYLRKTMGKLWVLMQPQNWSSADINFISNVAESTISKHIEYKKQWFDDVHFGDFSFKSSTNPQPFKLKLKAKKFTNLKITIKNEENSTCTILSLVLQVESFGYSK